MLTSRSMSGIGALLQQRRVVQQAVAIDPIPRFGKYTNWIGSPLLCNTYVAESSTVVNYEARDDNHRPADRRAGGSSADHRRHKANRHTSRNAVGGPTAEVGCTSAEYECFIVERHHTADPSTAPNNSGATMRLISLTVAATSAVSAARRPSGWRSRSAAQTGSGKAGIK